MGYPEIPISILCAQLKPGAKAWGLLKIFASWKAAPIVTLKFPLGVNLDTSSCVFSNKANIGSIGLSPWLNDLKEKRLP